MAKKTSKPATPANVSPAASVPVTPVNALELRKGSLITLHRGPLDRQYIVTAIGRHQVRVKPEGGEKDDSFLVTHKEVASIISSPTPKAGSSSVWKDRTGAKVKRVIYIPGTGYHAYLIKSKSGKVRHAPIVDKRVDGSGTVDNGAVSGLPVFSLDRQLPEAKVAILTDPSKAPTPEKLGLVQD